MLNGPMIELGAKVIERMLQKGGFIPAPDAQDQPPTQADLMIDTIADKGLALIQRGDMAATMSRLETALAPELRRLRALVSEAGRALGACEVCLGRDASCSRCGGTLRSGSRLPDRALYEHYVCPANDRVAAARASARAASQQPLHQRSFT
jgi:hypothetical protein